MLEFATPYVAKTLFAAFVAEGMTSIPLVSMVCFFAYKFRLAEGLLFSVILTAGLCYRVWSHGNHSLLTVSVLAMIIGATLAYILGLMLSLFRK